MVDAEIEAVVLALVVVRRALSMQSANAENGKPERGVGSALEKEARRRRGEPGADESGERKIVGGEGT